MEKLKPCPSCGCNDSDYLKAWHILTRRLPWWWFLECDNCHYCSKTKLFRFRAIKAWNEESKMDGKENSDGET